MIRAPDDDPLWPEFKPLWSALKKSGGSLLVAGGYGLFLKQHWLLAERGTPTVVPLAQWPDSAPRVTKDVDIVVGVDIIASGAAQAIMAQAMKDHRFEEMDPRWQFRKSLGQGRQVVVEFHSYPPSRGTPHIDMDQYRVKHKPSLGDAGIHGRQNPEAIGIALHPYVFELDGIDVAVPNPVTWCLMKLVAMHDRWQKADDPTREEEFRTLHRNQAIKHAQDLCRIVALITMEERDRAAAIVEKIQGELKYQSAARICADYFAAQGRATQVARPLWAANDLGLLREMLNLWFPERK